MYYRHIHVQFTLNNIQEQTAASLGSAPMPFCLHTYRSGIGTDPKYIKTACSYIYVSRCDPANVEYRCVQVLFTSWLSTVYLSLAEQRVVYPGEKKGEIGWAWAGPGDAVEASAMHLMVMNALDRAEEGEAIAQMRARGYREERAVAGGIDRADDPAAAAASAAAAAATAAARSAAALEAGVTHLGDGPELTGNQRDPLERWKLVPGVTEAFEEVGTCYVRRCVVMFLMSRSFWGRCFVGGCLVIERLGWWCGAKIYCNDLGLWGGGLTPVVQAISIAGQDPDCVTHGT